MEDEFYHDLLGDFDGKLLEIQLDDQDDDQDDDGNTLQSLVVDCSAISISLAVNKRVTRESPKQHQRVLFATSSQEEEESDDDAEWLRLVLSSFDVDAILSELNSSESHETGAFDQVASILDVSLVDIDFEPADQKRDHAAKVHLGNPPTPQVFGEYLFSPTMTCTPAPMLHHHLASWSTGAVLHRQLVRRQLEPLLPSTAMMLPPVLLRSPNSTSQCQHPQCTQAAVIMDMCYVHADELFEQLQPQTTQKQTRKRRRAVFSTGTKRKQKTKAKATEKSTTTVKAAKKSTTKQQKEQQQQQHTEEDTGVEQQEAKARAHIRPLRSRRNRRISYGEAAI